MIFGDDSKTADLKCFLPTTHTQWVCNSSSCNKQIFINTCLPIGLRPASKLFTVLADLLSWILAQQQVTPVMHYLDDFLTMGPHNSPLRANKLQRIKDTCTRLGIPLESEKIEQCLTFLEITLDMELMQVCLPEDKLSPLLNQIKAWLSSRKATKRKILSLVGLLQHGIKVVVPGRTFVSRIYKAAALPRKLSYSTRLTADFW